MENVIVGAVDIYPVCDACFKGSSELISQNYYRKLIGSDLSVPVRLCPLCDKIEKSYEEELKERDNFF